MLDVDGVGVKAGGWWGFTWLKAELRRHDEEWDFQDDWIGAIQLIKDRV